MSNGTKCRLYKCCRDLLAIIKRFAIVLFTQMIGWAIFSYVEDNFNVIDCFVNPHRVADTVYPISNETERANVLFSKLYYKTGQVLSVNQSIETYSLFRSYFNVQNQAVISRSAGAFRACVKWYRFSVVTMSTIGFGEITPKSSTGKLLVILYALVTIPVMLSFLAFIGSMISKWTDSTMMFVHKCIKGNKPLRFKELKRCFYLFIGFWIISIIVFLNYIAVPTAFESTGAMRWLDGLYFTFVTFTTIGFGDITGPAQDPSFFAWNFALGLAALSGFTDSLISLISSFEISSREGATCCFIHCKVDEDDSGSIDNGDCGDSGVISVDGIDNSRYDKEEVAAGDNGNTTHL